MRNSYYAIQKLANAIRRVMSKYLDEGQWGSMRDPSEFDFYITIDGEPEHFITCKVSAGSDAFYITLYDVFDRLEKKVIEQVISFENDFLLTKFLKNLEKYLTGDDGEGLITVKTITQVFYDKLETYALNEPDAIKVHKRTDDELVVEFMNGWRHVFEAYYKDDNTIHVTIYYRRKYYDDFVEIEQYAEDVDVMDHEKIRKVYRMMDEFLESILEMWYDSVDNPPRYGDWVDYGLNK